MPPLFAQFEFAAPSRLIVLVLLPALVWLALGGRGDQSLRQRMVSAGLRCLVVALLCIAWATPQWLAESSRRLVVFVVDRSESCGADAESARRFVDQAIAARSANEAKFLPFATAPGAMDVKLALPTAASTGSQLLPPGTDIAAAITLAQAACPPDWVPQIVLLSDGLETSGDALAAAVAARIPISTVPLAPLARPEVAVDRIDAPASAAADEPLEIVVTLASNHDAAVAVKLLRDGQPIAQKKLDVSAGTTTWRTSALLGPLAGAEFRAVIEPDDPADDTFRANNSLAAIVLSREPGRVLIVDSQPELAHPLRRALAAGGLEASIVSPQQMPENAKQLEQYRLIVLSDVSASVLGAARTSAVGGYVRGGGGLIAVGGEAAFGAATYELTPLERMLPVVASDQPVEQQKSLALVLVIDKSLSMLEEGRLALAKEAAKKVIGVLQPHDLAGVLAFGDESQWVSRLGPLNNKKEVLEQIEQLQASGLTNMYPAMERAYLALSQADAESRHMIVLTDGVPTPGDFDEVARRMAADGITVSTVSLGQGADQTILKDIARVARGTHHHVRDPKELPQLLERETRTAASKVAAGQFTAEAYRQLPGLDVSTAPPLLGYVTTRYKPGAQLLLVAGEGDPLLAWWRYGRGVAMALTTDVKNRWGAPWHDWPGYNAFWRRLAGLAMRDEPLPTAVITVFERRGELTVWLDAVQPSDDGLRFINGAQASLRVIPQNARGGRHAVRSLAMLQAAPGRYAVSFPVGADEPLMLDVSLRSGETLLFQQSRGWVTRYADELRLAPADVEKLKTIAAATGGRYRPAPPSVFAPDGRTVRIVQPLWPYLLMAAVVVFVIDVAAGRMRIRKPAAAALETRMAA